MEDDRCKVINEKLHINNYSWIILVLYIYESKYN